MAEIAVPHPGASDIVGRLLSEALSEHPDFQWIGLVSEDGFAIASEGDFDVDDDAVAAGAVRMMIQVRAMSKALDQSGTSHMFLEGASSGVCVIDKDPWVLVMVGAPGVPIGLLRYEAREIADVFPSVAKEALPWPGEEEQASDGETEEQVINIDGEPEIRWADEGFPDAPEPAAEVALETDVVDEVTDIDGEPEIRWADEGFADLTAPEPATEVTTDDVRMQPPVMPVGEVFEFEELSTPTPAPAAPAVDLSSLAPPVGASFELPPPSGPAFELPPPE